jgi:hypothetical protein
MAEPWWLNADNSRYNTISNANNYGSTYGINMNRNFAPQNFETIPNRVDTTYPQNVNFYDDSEHSYIPPDAEKTGIWESLKSKLGNIPFPSISHLINKTTRPGADLSFAGYPDGTASRGGLYETEVANMQKLADMGRLTSGGKDRISGKNVVSGFGNYNEGMQKSLDRFKETAAAKGFGTEEDPDLDRLKTYYENRYGPIRDNAVLQRLTHARQMTGGNDGNNWTDGTDGGSFKTGDKNYGFDDSGGFTGEGLGGSSGPSENYGFDDSGSFSGEGFGDSSGPSEDYGFDDSGGFTGEGWAKGGRIGYNRGRVVNPGGYSGNTYSDFLADKTVIPHPDDKSWRDVFYRWLDSRKAQGGLIGYFDGGIAGLL